MSSLPLLPTQAADTNTFVPEPSTDSPTVVPTILSTVDATAVPGLGTTVTVSTHSHVYTI
jgi:hypothetical protein